MQFTLTIDLDDLDGDTGEGKGSGVAVILREVADKLSNSLHAGDASSARDAAGKPVGLWKVTS